MDRSDDEANSPLDRNDQEVGAALGEDPESFAGMVPHFYRGEISQATAAQDRIDRTTDWAIALLAALLSLVFSSPDMPAYLLLFGLLVMCVFLVYEVRRYRFYDLWRARVRFVQENVFANALEPVGAEHPNWREELSDDLRYPTFKVSALEALSRRIRRVYGLLFAVLALTWVLKVTLFTPEATWTEAAEIYGVPGPAVAALLAAFLVGVGIVAVLPARRRAKGEIHGEEAGDWKD